jgi:hypothetical protein
MRKAPESSVRTPDCLPRIVTDVRGSGFSFSSSSLPETKADLFCAVNDCGDRKKRAISAGSTILNEKRFNEFEIRQIWLQTKTHLPGFYVYLAV